MITNIRIGQWETNSSSCHQILICGAGVENDEYKFPEKVDIKTGSFGWDFMCYRSIEGRLSYIVSVLVAHLSNDNDGERLLDEYLNKIKKVMYDNGVKEITGPYSAEEMYDSEYDLEYNKYEYEDNIRHIPASVDHVDDYFDSVTKLIDDENKLKDFLFYGTSMVITGNDNGYTRFDAPISWSIDHEIRNKVW